MSVFGIYFGPSIISVVETSGKKLISNVQIPRAKTTDIVSDVKVSEDIKIVALLKDELRRSQVEAKEAAICLSGRDLIIRTFEVPSLPREELENAISFEAKKYIPFKVEDLVSDYHIEYDKATRKNLVLFAGIKKDTLQTYLSVLSQLDIKVSELEYSAFSLLRMLRLADLSDKGIISVISSDLQEQDEVNFTVLENGFPLFSRDIILTGEAGLETPEPTKQEGSALEKLKAELRVSLDFYSRKFPSKTLEKIYLISDPDSSPEVEAFLRETGSVVQSIDVTRLISEPVSFSLSFTKAYSSALSKTIQAGPKISLLESKAKVKPFKVAVKETVAEREETAPLATGLKIDSWAIVLGAVLCVAAFGYGLSQRMPLQKEIKGIIGSRPKVTTVNPEEPYDKLTNLNSEYAAKLDIMDNLIKKQLYLTQSLNMIPGIIPKGMWLTNFSLVKGDREAEFVLEGKVYLGNSNQEMEAVNKLLSALKANQAFSGYFQEMNISSLDSAQIAGTPVTNFRIACRGAEKTKR